MAMASDFMPFIAVFALVALLWIFLHSTNER